MKATIEGDDELYRQLKTEAALRESKVKLPMVKSRKPSTLKLTNRMIAKYEAGTDQ